MHDGKASGTEGHDAAGPGVSRLERQSLRGAASQMRQPLFTPGYKLVANLERFPLFRRASKFFSPFVIEFIGTFFLVLSVCLSAGRALAALSIGATLMAVVFLGGHVSGGHYNPAVTIAIFIARRGKINLTASLLYIFTQFFASVVAACAAWALEGDTFRPTPGLQVSLGRALFGETLWTYLLCTVVLQTGTTATQAGNSFYGLAIGFTVTAGAIVVGPISGGAFNPAVGTGPTIIHSLNHGSANMEHIWLYWAGPFTGALLAGLTFWFTNYSTEFLPVYALDHGRDPVSLFSSNVPTLGDRSGEVSHKLRLSARRVFACCYPPWLRVRRGLQPEIGGDEEENQEDDSEAEGL